ncbi:MAG: hypothetical protein EA397_04495 [Deltaproteobacteria bacterium]|nr:MAG: hypothetical protein EA397_04495 [Deltaproteobacteria bacterium]
MADPRSRLLWLLASALVSLAHPTTSVAAPLDLSLDQLPTVEPSGPHQATWIRFPQGLRLQALPAVILTQEPGPPPHPLAQPLGPSGRSWRVPTRSVDEAITLGAELRQRPGVRSALPDLILPHVQTRFDDPRFPSQWYLDVLEMDPLYELSLGDPQVRVAVIDSGIDLDHPDLQGSWVQPYDALSDSEDPRPSPGDFCQGSSTELCDHHGTAVSGIIAARANNGIDIVGLCPECTLVPIRLLGPGEPTLGADVAAFEHAIATDAAVINNSWAFGMAMPVPAPLADIIHVASTESRGGLGALVVFAAGNSDRELLDDELQALPDVLCVTATDRYGLPTSYTNRGAAVDVAAPSATVTLQAGSGITTNFGGTSAAAPVVAGLAGWAVSVDPTLSAQELHQIFRDAATPSPLVTHDERGHHLTFGYGEISGPSLLAQLDLDEAHEARACGCATAPASPAIPSLLLALVWLVRRRTSANPTDPEPTHGPRRRLSRRGEPLPLAAQPEQREPSKDLRSLQASHLG